MRLDLSFVLWVGSLIVSAIAVVVFLWLMREPRESGIGSRESKDAGGDPSQRKP